jgi:hypothetical protein
MKGGFCSISGRPARRECGCKFVCLTEPFLLTSDLGRWKLKKPLVIYKVEDRDSPHHYYEYSTQDGVTFHEIFVEKYDGREEKKHRRDRSQKQMLEEHRFSQYRSTDTPSAYFAAVHQLARRREVLDYLVKVTSIPAVVLLIIVDEFSDLKLVTIHQQLFTRGH